MELHRTALKVFLMWLVAVAVGLITYMIHLGSPHPQLIQTMIIGALIALCVIYLVLRAAQVNKTFATVLAVSWFIGPSVLFALVPFHYGQLLMILLLLLAISQNLAVTVLLKRRASQ